MISSAESILVLISVLILSVYHFLLWSHVRKAPLTTAIGLTNQLRRDWVETIMQENRDILAVQTLRNWVMASSFLASTAILISLGIISAAFNIEKIAELSSALNLLGSQSEALWLLKMMVLIVDFFFAFFNFTLSIRYYNHAGLAINIPTAKDAFVTADRVADILNHGAIHYTLGMRGFYLAIVFALWLFGPTWMLIGSVVLVVILNGLDRKT